MMKVLVTVKQVATVEDRFEVEGSAIPEEYLEYGINEWDDYAVETAVQLAEAREDVEVVAASIGPERVEETMRIALAKGVDRGIRIWDEALARNDLLDVPLKAALLQAVVEQEQPDIVLTGVQALDDSFAGTGVALAAQAGYNWAAVVNNFELRDEATVGVHRELEGGMSELVDVALPAVFTIQTGINDPRYASLRGIRQAQQKEIVTQTLEDLDISSDAARSDIALMNMVEPESESDVELFEGAADDTAQQLGDLLDEMGVIEA